MKSKHYPTILTIAGSDSIGGAGIQADIKTATSLGVYSMSVITAVTAQNTLGVQLCEPINPFVLYSQLKAVIDDVRPDAVKIGMIPSVSSVKTIARFIEENKIDNVILDPVCVSTSGHHLTDENVPEALAEELFHLVDLVTPNIPEAEYFLRVKIGENDVERASYEFARRWKCEGVLIKGGHREQRPVSTDVLNYRGTIYQYSSPRIDSRNTHGTGCALSTAIASYLALGLDMPDAVQKAKSWLTEAIIRGKEYEFGQGSGPLFYFK